MNLTSPSQVKAWCIENGFHPNKTLGQNFLIDRNALVAIVDAGLEGCRGAEVPKCRVLEIGPGLGVLTEELLSRGCEVVAIEKDPVLAFRLAKEAAARTDGEPIWKNLTVIEGDALDAVRGHGVPAPPDRDDVDTNARPGTVWLRQDASAPFSCMVSNLPYQAGTRILLELVHAHEIPSMTVLVQTEVAERLAAGPGSKTRSLAGVWAQLDYDVKIVRKVAANCFWPRPEIGSSVVRLTRHGRNAALAEAERKLFHRLTKQAFEHRRKQLGSIFKDMIQSTARAEELSNDDWLSLVRDLIREQQD